MTDEPPWVERADELWREMCYGRNADGTIPEHPDDPPATERHAGVRILGGHR